MRAQGKTKKKWLDEERKLSRLKNRSTTRDWNGQPNLKRREWRRREWANLFLLPTVVKPSVGLQEVLHFCKSINVEDATKSFTDLAG